MFSQDSNRLIFTYDAEKLWIEPWGANALRVRATKLWRMPEENFALQIPVPPEAHGNTKIEISNSQASITNGAIKAVVSSFGKIMVHNTTTGKVLLEEYARNRNDLLDPKCSSLAIEAREFAPIPTTDNYRLSVRFESQDPEERIYGMGQYQQPFLNLKGMDLELAHRNSQASVPFAVSSLGYGFLWNNPGIGRVTFGKYIHTWEAYSTNVLDYWVITSLDGRPSDLVEGYARVTGTVPMMPEYGLGFWQCKLRYQTQEELLEVVREYRRRKLPLDVIVCDFFHWELQGEYDFDRTYWPDPGELTADHDCSLKSRS
jgi:alpha-D-xyloside xylohydrolase